MSTVEKVIDVPADQLEVIQVDESLKKTCDEVIALLDSAKTEVLAFFSPNIKTDDNAAEIEGETTTTDSKALLMYQSSKELTVVAGNFKIKTAEENERAAKETLKVKSIGNAVESRRKTITTPLDAAKKIIQTIFSPPAEYCKTAEGLLKKSMLEYSEEQDRKQRLAEAKAQEDARKEQEKLAAKAASAQEKGKDDVAQELFEQASQVVAKPVVSIAPAVATGMSKTMTYSAEVPDLLELVKAIAEGKAPITLVVADMKALNGMARALKEGFSLPGCKLVKTPGLAARASKAA